MRDNECFCPKCGHITSFLEEDLPWKDGETKVLNCENCEHPIQVTAESRIIHSYSVKIGRYDYDVKSCYSDDYNYAYLALMDKDEEEEPEATCDPCVFCRHITDESDESVGLQGYGCDSSVVYEEDWEPGLGKPCPGFEPIFASDGLLHQIC